MMAGLWTNNYQSLKNSWMCGDVIPDISALKDSTGTMRFTVSDAVNYHGNDWILTSPLARMQVTDTSGYSGYTLVEVGGGSSAPAVTDYAMTAPLTNISYLSVVNDKPVWDENTGEVSNTIHLTIQNTAAVSQTISEWGLYVRVPTYRGGTSFLHYLVYHATLDSPVSLAPAQSVTLALTRSVTLTDPVVWPE